jgi:hypothetical protein
MPRVVFAPADGLRLLGSALAGASLRPLASMRVLGLTINIIGLLQTQIANRVTASSR